MRLPTLELGAGTYRDLDIDRYNDILPIEGLDYICDARTIPEEDGVFSIITANQMIEHLDAEGQVELVQECCRLLAKDGILLLWTPDLEWMDNAVASKQITQDWYDTLLAGKGDGEWDRHRRLLTKETLETLLVENGFSVLSVIEMGGSIECVGVKNGL